MNKNLLVKTILIIAVLIVFLFGIFGIPSSLTPKGLLASMQQRIRVQKPIATRFGAGQLQVDVPIRNLTDGDLTVDFLYYFMNNRGIQVGEQNVDHVTIPRKGIGQIEIKSMSAVDDFRIEIRDAK